MSETETPRRFALLGSENLWSLTMALVHSDTHKVVAMALTDRTADKAGKLSLHDDWESLLNDDAVDAVIVCGERPEVLEFARQLAARGKPLIVPVWPTFPREFVAELSLFDAEGTSKLLPCFENRQEAEPLRELIADGRLGTITSIQLDRSDADFTRFGSDHTWHSGVRFDDIDWLRLLGGDYSQVTLIRSGGDDAGTFVTQTLQLAGPGLPDAICTYRRSNSPSDLRLRIDGSEGTAELQLEGEGEQREFVVRVDGVETLRQSTTNDPAKLLADLDRSWKQEPGSAQWRDFVRVHEISEAMQRSLRRRRTIDLHFETASERSQFKTQMATVGCFVLVYTFFASVAMLFAGAVLDPRDKLQRTSEAADFILTRDEFDAASDQLTPLGEQHLEEIAKRWQSSTAAVVILESDSQSDQLGEVSSMDRNRLTVVQRHLSEKGVRRVEERTVVRRLAADRFRTLMTIGRVIAFAPLGVFLLMQLLLFVSRPPRVVGSHQSMQPLED